MAKRKPGPPPPDPDADWNTQPIDHAAVLVQCASIRAKIKEAPSDVWRRSTSFFDDVDRQVARMAESIGQSRHVSEKMQKALNSWEAAIDRCLVSKG